MRRALQIALAMLLTGLAGGCWIFVETDEDCDSWFGDCGVGLCDDDWCDDSGSSSSGGGSSGAVGGACVPGATRYCDTPAYCSWGEQRCNDAGDGWSSCYETSPPPGCGGFAYDQDCCLDAGACCQDWLDLDDDGDWNDSIGECEEVVAPDPGPCPSGECGCRQDSECDEGLLCIASRCTRPDSVCFFDFECGVGSLCLDNECHASCSEGCPAGQVCSASLGICLEPAEGLHGCVYDEDCACPDQVCINATCHAACTASEGCGEGEACIGGACRADAAPVHECSSDGDCQSGMSCLRGECRLPCVADLNCRGDASVCGEASLCLHPVELAPSCLRAEDCGQGESCLSNVCRQP